MIAGLVAALAGSRLIRSALRFALTVAAVLLLLLACRRSGEGLGRPGERLETSERTDVQRRTLEAAARRPRDRGELAERLRDGRF